MSFQTHFFRGGGGGEGGGGGSEAPSGGGPFCFLHVPSLPALNPADGGPDVASAISS